ncbi:hypothetical protein ADK91_08155 [Streptomyces sp. XY511]|nr:hypothetical protein ADK91_08155 [Streptomyces sp. XY511]
MDRALVDWLQRDAAVRQGRPSWVYSSTAALLLDVGRLFTPAPWPGDVLPPGEPGKCFIESIMWAKDSDELTYVEGWAWDVAYPVEHAWCSTAGGIVRDLTWPRPGASYLGLPVAPDAAAALMGRHGTALLHDNGMATPVALEWMRDGVPAELLVDVGRAVPAV